MAKLKPDYINWVLNLNAKQVHTEIAALEKEERDLRQQQKSLQDEMNKLIGAGKKNSQEYKNFKQQLSQVNKSLDENRKKTQLCVGQLDKSQMSANQLAKRMRELKRELMNTSKAADPKEYKRLSQELEQTEKAFRKSLEGAKTWKEKFKEIKNEIGKGILFGIGQSFLSTFTDAFRNAGSIIADFEAANSRLAAILGTTKDAITDMTEQAKELGASTSYTASEVTQLQIELAKLGFAREEIKAATPEILDFAKAVDTDLGSAASLTGAALRIFGLEAEQTGRVVSTMAIGTTSSALSFEYLNSALATVGPVASSFGFTIEETTALLGQLANSGFDASSAATATRNMMLNMADSSGKLAKALGKPVTDLDSLIDGLQKLNAEGVNLVEMLELTDKRSVAAFNTFLQGADKLGALRDSVTDCHDKFKGMAEEMGNNVRGSMATLQSSIEGLILKFYESRGAMKIIIDLFTKLIQGIGWIIDKFGTLIAIMGTAIVTYKLLTAEKLKAIAATVKATAAEVAHKIALMASTTHCSRLTAALKVLWGTMLRHPLAMALVAITAVTAAIVALKGSTDAQTEAQRKMNDAFADTQAEINSEKRHIDELFNKLKKAKEGTDEYKAAKDAILSQYGQYLSGLSEEVRSLKDVKGAYDAVTTAAIKAAKARGMQRAMETANEEYAERYSDAYKELLDMMQESNRNAYNQKDALQMLNWIASDIEETGSADSYVVGKILDRLYGTDRYLYKGAYSTGTSEPGWEKFERYVRVLENATRQRNEEQKIAEAMFGELDAMATPTPDSTPTPSGNRYADPKKTSHTGSHSKPSPTKQAMDRLRAEHDERMALIEQQGREQQQLETDIEASRALENERYAKARLEALKTLAEKTADTDADESNKIKEQQAKANLDLLDAQQQYQNAALQQVKDYRDQQTAIEDAYYQEQKDSMERAVASREVTQQQADTYLLAVEREHAMRMLQINNEYRDNLHNVNIQSDQQRIQEQNAANEAIREAQMQHLRAVALIAQKVRETANAEPIGINGIRAQYEEQRRQVAASYDAVIQLARQEGFDVTALEEQKNQQLLQLDYDYRQKQWDLQQQIGTTWQQQYDNELAHYQNLLDRKMISEREFERKKQQLQIANAKKYFDYYAGLSSSMVQAIQQAEIDTVEAKYDALIRLAENNGEDTAALEEEKENKKLDIQKKYADVNFAIKCSQIIADTAVAIMKAYADLGPIAGSVAAALLGVTGAAQLLQAKAERDKVKNLQSKGASSASAQTAERIVGQLPGYSTGGYTGDGGRYEVAGVVHRGEYVVPKPIMRLPQVAGAVGMIETLRRRHIPSVAVSQQQAAFADGGYTGDATSSISDIRQAAHEIRQAADSIRIIRAHVVYQDIERARDTLNDARAPFTRSH